MGSNVEDTVAGSHIGESANARASVDKLLPFCTECGQYGNGHAQWCSAFDAVMPKGFFTLPGVAQDNIADFEPVTNITAGVAGSYYHMPTDNAPPSQSRQTAVRRFETGATRDSHAGKLDYEACLSPLVLRRFAQYMNKHCMQPDGSRRATDNWQKGIPTKEYMKSAWRHFMDIWTLHRGIPRDQRLVDLHNMEESLCALLFNVMGMLYEELRGPQAGEKAQ